MDIKKKGSHLALLCNSSITYRVAPPTAAKPFVTAETTKRFVTHFRQVRRGVSVEICRVFQGLKFLVCIPPI